MLIDSHPAHPHLDAAGILPDDDPRLTRAERAIGLTMLRSSGSALRPALPTAERRARVEAELADAALSDDARFARDVGVSLADWQRMPSTERTVRLNATYGRGAIREKALAQIAALQATQAAPAPRRVVTAATAAPAAPPAPPPPAPKRSPSPEALEVVRKFAEPERPPLFSKLERDVIAKAGGVDVVEYLVARDELTAQDARMRADGHTRAARTAEDRKVAHLTGISDDDFTAARAKLEAEDARFAGERPTGSKLTGSKLTAAERAVCAATGMDEREFRAAKLTYSDAHGAS
jgi:hypothetical protein